MTLGSLLWRNLRRNRLRVALTVAAASITIIAFILLRTVLGAFQFYENAAPRDRMITRHRISSTVPLTMRSVDVVRGVPGVDVATFGSQLRGKDAASNRPVTGLAVDPVSFLKAYSEIALSEPDKEHWLSERQGAIVGDSLAHDLGLTVGGRFTVSGPAGRIPFTVIAIHSMQLAWSSRQAFFVHWEYVNELRDSLYRDRIDRIWARVRSPDEAASVGAAIDHALDGIGVPTLTMSERAGAQMHLARFSAIFAAVDIGSLVILLVMVLLLANTIAMGVRERRVEYGVLRVLGFGSGHIGGLILGEAAVTGLIAGGTGSALSYPIVELGMGRWLVENTSGLVNYFGISPPTFVAAIIGAAVLAALGAILPMIRALRVPPIDAVRRVA